MTAILRLESLPLLSPLQGYDLAERQRRRLGESFRTKILARYRAVPDEKAACGAYRDLVMRLGVRRVDPASPRFFEDLGEFHQNYVRNFPVPPDQESFDSFRRLLSAPDRADGYREFCYSVRCPLTGAYLMGADFAVQPESNSAVLIYGFVNPAARGIGGFARRLAGLVEEKAREAIAAFLGSHPDRTPPYYDPAQPLILFEKNVVEDMTLPEILMDSAGIDIDRPPSMDRLLAWGIGQRSRDLVWHRCGARIVDYRYFQSSLQGVVEVPERERDAVIAHLLGERPADRYRARAESVLETSLRGRTPGCAALDLCILSHPEKQSLPLLQLRQAVESFEGTSVVKDPARLRDDVYFQAQMKSLAESAAGEEIRLRPILPGGAGAREFSEAEEETRRLLREVSWQDLRAARRRPYRDWLAMTERRRDHA